MVLLYGAAFEGIPVIGSADTKIVWTAAKDGDGFTFKNGGYYLYPAQLIRQR